jgi:hypothetical protein
MEDPVVAAISRMEALCDSILFKLESCLERFDQSKYETTVTKLKFLGQKYLALRQVRTLWGREGVIFERKG